MTARFIPSDYPGGRILLRSGSVDVGAVFPPPGGGVPWRWRFWGGSSITANPFNNAKTELAAKSALLAEWRQFLRAAGLTETATEKDTDE